MSIKVSLTCCLTVLEQKWNEVLRNQGGRGEASPYTTTIHTLVSAVLKLSTQTQVSTQGHLRTRCGAQRRHPRMSVVNHTHTRTVTHTRSVLCVYGCRQPDNIFNIVQDRCRVDPDHPLLDLRGPKKKL
jgi:hypothetical protein